MSESRHDADLLLREFDDPIPLSAVYRNMRTGEPKWSRTEWREFGRWRRWRDVLLGWDPVELPRERAARLEARRERKEAKRAARQRPAAG